jgi:hypothetical protein
MKVHLFSNSRDFTFRNELVAGTTDAIPLGEFSYNERNVIKFFELTLMDTPGTGRPQQPRLYGEPSE